LGGHLLNADHWQRGYLMRGQQFLTVVTFQLNEAEDELGQPHVVGGDMVLKGEVDQASLEDALTIHAEQGYSIHLEITHRPAQGPIGFRIHRTGPQ
jgi:hypothetical protein